MYVCVCVCVRHLQGRQSLFDTANEGAAFVAPENEGLGRVATGSPQDAHGSAGAEHGDDFEGEEEKERMLRNPVVPGRRRLVSVGLPEVLHDVLRLVHFGVGVGVHEEGEHSGAAHLTDLGPIARVQAHAIGSKRFAWAGVDDVVDCQLGECLPHATAEGTALELVELQGLRRSLALVDASRADRATE